MKNNILLIGVILTFLNTIIGLVLSDYSNFNTVFADVSILVSTGIVYFLFQSTIADGFKIGLSFFFLLTGLARFICAVFSNEQLENNIAFILFICLVAVEVVVYFLGKNLSSK